MASASASDSLAQIRGDRGTRTSMNALVEDELVVETPHRPLILGSLGRFALKSLAFSANGNSSS